MYRGDNDVCIITFTYVCENITATILAKLEFKALGVISEHLGVVGHIAVTAGAGIGCVTTIGYGRLGYNSSVAVGVGCILLGCAFIPSVAHTAPRE